MNNLPKLCCLLMLAGVATAHAEALVKPLPNPDLSKLPADVAKQLKDARAEFDKDKVNMEAEVLGAGYAQLGALYFRAGLLDVADLAFYDEQMRLVNEPGRIEAFIAPDATRGLSAEFEFR